MLFFTQATVLTVSAEAAIILKPGKQPPQFKMCEMCEYRQNMAMGILVLGVIRTCFYDCYEECPEKIVDDFYYDCEDDDLHDE